MNIFAIIIFVALVLEFTLGLIGNSLNLSALRTELPPSLRGIYKQEDYLKSQQYLRSTTWFGLLGNFLTLILLLVFWFIGGFNWLDQVVRMWHFSPLISGLLYLGILFLAHSILILPLSIYGTFVIEERFGFNRTTPITFLMDLMKELGLAVVVGGMLLTGILALFQYANVYAWLYCWAAVVVLSLLVQYIAPTWIMPLFNKFTPMEPGETKEAVIRYANSVKFHVKDILVMDGSRRSSKSNAFFTGFGRNKRIVFFDTLIVQHTTSELVAVLAHEVGHYKKKHIIQGTIISIFYTGMIFFLLSLFLDSPGLYRAFFMRQESIYAGLLFFGLLYTPLKTILAIVIQMVSRKNEYEADRFSVETTNEPDSLINALKKLSATNLSNLTPHPLYVFMNYSHPPLMQRIEAIEKTKT